MDVYGSVGLYIVGTLAFFYLERSEHRKRRTVLPLDLSGGARSALILAAILFCTSSRPATDGLAGSLALAAIILGSASDGAWIALVAEHRRMGFWRASLEILNKHREAEKHLWSVLTEGTKHDAFPPPAATTGPSRAERPPPERHRRREARMTERHFLAGLVFRLLRPEHAAAGTVDDRALTLRFRQGSERIPLRYISSLDLSHDLARSTLTVRHAAGTAVLSGLAPSEASDLASSVNAARQHWWTRTLAAERDTLTALDEILRRFDTPSVFLTADRQRRIAAAARACLRYLAGEMPESLRETPLFPALDRVRIFLDDPDETRRLANAHYIHRELIATRELLDTIESRPLTPEQRAAVVTDERSNLVVASAGSGKTSVIVAKAAWLIQRRRYDPSDLLLLAFAREARAEMQQRIETRMGASRPAKPPSSPSTRSAEASWARSRAGRPACRAWPTTPRP